MIELTKEERASSSNRRRAAHYNKGFEDGYEKRKSEERAAAEPDDLPYHCDVCSTPGYGDAPCSPLCTRAAQSVVVKALEDGQAGWIKHDGKTMPVNGSVRVEVRLANGFEHEADFAENWLKRDGSKSNWHHDLGTPHPCDIVGYRIATQVQEVARKPEFTMSFTGTDGCATVLSHWPEGYALQRHGEIVWRENIPPAQTLDQRMKSAGMYTIEEMLGVTPLTKWKSNPAINTVEHFSEWLDQKTAEYLRMKAGYDLGDKSEDDELYEWVLAHAGVFSSIRDQFRVVTATPAANSEGQPND